MKHFFLRPSGLVLTAGLLFFTACKKDNNNNPGTPIYTVPDTYQFANADSLTAKTYLSMIGQMEGAINSANIGNAVSSTQLNLMYANTGGYFRDTTFGSNTINLNSSGLQLKNITTSSAQILIQTILDSIGIDSQTGLPASNGVAGVSDRKTLLSANGIYWRQFFTKTVMGAVIGHLITDVFLGDSLNSGISSAAKQHAWDNAFYLWCVPGNFPANRTGVKYWGSYTSQIDSGIIKPVVTLTGINANTTLLNAFLKGRAALANNDSATAVAQANIIIPFFETMEAAAALHETNEAKGNLPNGAAAVCGNLSESFGFWTTLGLNPHKKISNADYQAVLALYGTNFYTTTPEGIQAIQDKISSIYGWDAIKSNL
jgi:Domain of unknown function (DUF4856)